MPVAVYLYSVCGGEFALVRDTSKNPNHIYYSRPLVVGSVTWPAEVVLMQGLCARSFNLFKQIVCVYKHQRDPSLDTMGKGMAKHLGATVAPLQIQPTQSPLAHKGNDTYLEIDASVILSREPPEFRLPDTPSPTIDLASLSHRLHRLYMMATLRLIDLAIEGSGQNGHHQPHGHNIAAMLVDSTGKVAATGINTAAANKTFHAEVNVLQGYGRTGLTWPDPSFLYTTLKPCDMCAAMIAQVLPNCTVIYAQNDPRATAQTAPLGGMHLLGTHSSNSKDMILPKSDFHNLTQELQSTTAQLQHGTTKYNSNYYLTNVLNSSQLHEVIHEGQEGLERKIDRYSIKQASSIASGKGVRTSKHPEVRKVLNHLAQVVYVDLSPLHPSRILDLAVLFTDPKMSSTGQDLRNSMASSGPFDQLLMELFADWNGEEISSPLSSTASMEPETQPTSSANSTMIPGPRPDLCSSCGSSTPESQRIYATDHSGSFLCQSCLNSLTQ